MYCYTFQKEKSEKVTKEKKMYPSHTIIDVNNPQ